jgi:DNA-binding NarL/FixJ family response regulator
MRKTILVFAGLILGLLILFQLSKYSIISGDLTIESAVAVIAIVFFTVGIYINKKSLNNNSQTEYEVDTKKIEQLGISSREYEVLQLISKGFSNKEIGDTLFLTESTIKTHVSNLLVKLDAKRRTQAIEIAKQLQIL